MRAPYSKSAVEFAYQSRLFHIGARVADIEAAMADMGAGLGLRWAGVMEREQPVWTPDGGARTVPLRFTYSCEGPQHVELLQSPPGSPWHGADTPGIHHVGYWATSVADEVERLTAGGWTLELAAVAPEDGYGSMAYLRSPSGLLVEPVDERVRERMERWWAGNAFA